MNKKSVHPTMNEIPKEKLYLKMIEYTSKIQSVFKRKTNFLKSSIIFRIRWLFTFDNRTLVKEKIFHAFNTGISVE